MNMAGMRPALRATLSLCLVAAAWTATPANAADGGCHLANGITHVFHLTFDNVHLRRDMPNVPSDLEQIPSLLTFLKDNGVILANHHTSLISHTADDIITAVTGVYGSRHGQPVANSYGVFDPQDPTNNTVLFASSFIYWTGKAPDGTPAMINEKGLTAPAPWVPFTRAGCDVGAFSTANMEFEDTAGDVA